MKSTYNLIGLFWDGKPLPTKLPDIIPISPNNHIRNRITLTTLLAVDDFGTGFPTENSQDIVLEIDYIPSSLTECVCDFYIRRLLQIIEALNEISNNVLVCVNDSELIKLKDTMQEYLKKEKHRNTMLAHQSDVSQKIC